MDQVLDELWIGNVEDANNVALLKTHGITAVVNLTPEQDHFVKDGGTEAQDFEYLQLNQPDGEEIPQEKIATFMNWMIRMRVANKVILIHCGAGISRAASFTICWLMFCGFSWDQGEAFVRAVRPIISPHYNLKKSVLEFFNKDWTTIYRNT